MDEINAGDIIRFLLEDDWFRFEPHLVGMEWIVTGVMPAFAKNSLVYSISPVDPAIVRGEFGGLRDILVRRSEIELLAPAIGLDASTAVEEGVF